MAGSLYPGDFPDKMIPGRRVPFVESFKGALGELPVGYIVAADWSGPLGSIWNVYLMQSSDPNNHNPDTKLGYSISDARDLAMICSMCIRTCSFGDLVSAFREDIMQIKRRQRETS